MKQSKEWVAKEVKEKKLYSFVYSLLCEVTNLKTSDVVVAKKASDTDFGLKSPKNIAGSERPETSTIVTKKQMFSRFVTGT